MPNIVASFRLGVLADTFGNDLMEKTGWQVHAVQSASSLPELCKRWFPDVVLLEVASKPPWDTAGCLPIVETIRKTFPQCKFVFWCDACVGQTGDLVVRAKREGLIDAFLFGSADLDYCVATIGSLLPL